MWFLSASNQLENFGATDTTKKMAGQLRAARTSECNNRREKMRAILIDPYNETIKEIKFQDGDGAINKIIDAKYFEAVYINHANAIMVDEDGLRKKDKFFKYAGYHQPLAGKGLLVGVNAPELCSTRVKVAD